MMSCGPRAFIDLNALRHNVQQVRQLAPHSRIWAVLKADAYGHGAQIIASALNTEGLAVARFDEAWTLRMNGETRPILILGGVYTAAEVAEAAHLDFELAVHDHRQIELIKTTPCAKSLRVWLKVNTGMNRLGLTPEAAIDARIQLAQNTNITQPPGLLTHLANADIHDDVFTHVQCQGLAAIVGIPASTLCIGNSAGILEYPTARSAWIRPGLMLYGASPFPEEKGIDRGLLPVMTLRAPLIAINQCQRGDRVGYGGVFECPESMPVGVLAVGYGDGYPRHLPTGTPVLLNGHYVPLIGRVSMDLITLDLRRVPNAQLGDEATLWGKDLPAEIIARAAGTIAYTLFTGVTQRVPRVAFS